MALIDINDIWKIYNVGDIELNALHNATLSIKEGEFVSIMGPSGSGKSTFMNILGCLDKPTKGKYFLDGIDVTFLDRDELASIRNIKIGFVFQAFNLIPRTSALENVELPMIYSKMPTKYRTKRATESLRIVGLENRENHTPNQLSGGQQQRVAIARAIVNDAPIILADEPTGNLDTKTSCEIMDLFVRLNKESGKTIILVTHEPDIAEYSERIIRFKDGQLVSDEVKG
jgi:putative ABC transport system ATP-binding protein